MFTYSAFSGAKVRLFWQTSKFKAYPKVGIFHFKAVRTVEGRSPPNRPPLLGPAPPRRPLELQMRPHLHRRVTHARPLRRRATVPDGFAVGQHSPSRSRRQSRKNPRPLLPRPPLFPQGLQPLRLLQAQRQVPTPLPLPLQGANKRLLQLSIYRWMYRQIS